MGAAYPLHVARLYICFFCTCPCTQLKRLLQCEELRRDAFSSSTSWRGKIRFDSDVLLGLIQLLVPAVTTSHHIHVCCWACSALRFGTLGPGFEPCLFHKACCTPLYSCLMKLRVFFVCCCPHLRSYLADINSGMQRLHHWQTLPSTLQL